jgi:two-component system sensor histidine kinase HydH
MKKGRRYKSLYLPALTIVATVLTLLIVISVSTYRNISRERGRTEDSLLRESRVIIRAIEAGVRAGFPSPRPDISRIQKIVEEVSHDPAVAAILLFNGGGNLIVSVPDKKAERVKDAVSLGLLLKKKGMVTRYHEVAGGERTFEVIKPFRPFSYEDPLAFAREAEGRVELQEERWYPWAKDKMISISLRLGMFKKARQEDIHHAFLMGAILVVLGTGALYFIFIVQNYYLVDRSLARMKTYTENVVESMADGLISIDNERKIVTLNRRAGEILGAAEEEWRGKKIEEVLGRDIEALLGSEEQRVIIRDREMELPHRSGKEIPLSLRRTPLKDEMGQEIGSVLLLRDLREIRDLQEKVRRSERLASLGRLAAGVAHEVRNPLSSIRGFAQYFMNRLKGHEEEQGYASIMVKEVDRLNRVITDLLDFARPKEPHRELHSLENIMDHSLKLLEQEWTGKKVVIEKEFEPNLPLALIDRDQISQAFLNLLLNSLESIGGGGKIRICLKKSRGQPSVEVSIADTGRGIPQEDLEKIFEPFFSTKRQGTGLGLAIVHQIVDNHGGDITVESREEVGTTFRITLPVKG